jgi:predicted Zn-dependent protease
MATVPAVWSDDLAYSIGERAWLLHSEGQYEESLILFEGLLDLYPENLYYMDAMAALNLGLGRPDAAARLASTVISRDPSHVLAHVRLCEACIGLRRFDEAETNVQQLRRLGAQNHARRMAMRLAASRAAAPFPEIE